MRACTPVAFCFGPGHSVGLVVIEFLIAGDLWKFCTSVQVLLLVLESDKTGSFSEVDDVELIIFKVCHFGVVAENECNSVASLVIPGRGRSEVNGELVADDSV